MCGCIPMGSGEYFEPFYLELEFTGKEIGVQHILCPSLPLSLSYFVCVSVCIDASPPPPPLSCLSLSLSQYRWHTLPAFVPLSALIVKYNSGDIQVNHHHTLSVFHFMMHLLL